MINECLSVSIRLAVSLALGQPQPMPKMKPRCVVAFSRPNFVKVMRVCEDATDLGSWEYLRFIPTLFAGQVLVFVLLYQLSMISLMEY